MKVALIHYQYLRRGGMEHYLVNLIKGFTEAGDEVTVITSKVAPEITATEQSRIIRINLSTIPKKLRGFAFARQVHRRLPRSEFDLTISLSRTWGQQITICGGTHKSYLHHMRKLTGALQMLEIATERRAYQSSRLIVAHSEMLKSEVTNLYGTSGEKVTVIHPPVDTSKFSQKSRTNRQALMNQYGISTDRITLLLVSNDHKRKGFTPLVEALKILPQDRFELVVAGTRLKKYGQLPNVRHVGYVERMEELYAAVDFTAIPSYYEPFGLVAVESLQCGTPVLISDKVGARDVISEDEGLVFESLMPDAIAAIILQAVEREFKIDHDLAQRRGLTLSQHVEQLKELQTNLQFLS